jgi:hypothetical protein
MAETVRQQIEGGRNLLVLTSLTQILPLQGKCCSRVALGLVEQIQRFNGHVRVGSDSLSYHIATTSLRPVPSNPWKDFQTQTRLSGNAGLVPLNGLA